LSETSELDIDEFEDFEAGDINDEDDLDKILHNKE
jgi:hypothetical protein